MSSLSQYLSPFSKALDLRVQRHQVLASNIANADTPQYKSRDFDFSDAMKNAMAGRPVSGGLEMARTAAGHLESSAGTGAVALKYRTEAQSAVDGNTVDMDVERSNMAENAMQYQILTQLVNTRLQGMRSALASAQG